MTKFKAVLVAPFIVAAFASAFPPVSIAGELVVGQSLGLTGAGAVAARQYQQGAQCFMDVLNKGGGIRGNTIRLVSLDDGGKADRTVENTRALIEREKAFVLFGFTSAAGARAALPLLRQQGVPLVGVAGGSSGVREAGAEGVGTVVVRAAPGPASHDSTIAASYRMALSKCASRDEPSAAGLEGFIAARVLVEGLLRAGSNPTRQALVDGIESIEKLDLGGFRIG